MQQTLTPYQSLYYAWLLTRRAAGDSVESLASTLVDSQVDYLRSQVGCDDVLADSASGLLLHPAVGTVIDETVVIQGHPLRFATVDLAAKPAEIRAQLLKCVEVRC